MKTKPKTCTGCGMEKPIWKSNGRDKYCKGCWLRLNPPHQPQRSTRSIAQRTPKRRHQEAEYSRLRQEKLLQQPFCELALPGCSGAATEVHHAKGRIGRLLTDTRYFRSACRSCHDWVTENSRQAIELGLSLSRLKKEDDSENKT